MFEVVRLRGPVLAAVALVLALGVVVAASHAEGPSPGSPLTGDLLRGRTVVIDPGHGGYDPGALGRLSREADINLAVALQLREWLRLAGARVLMTWSRPGQIPANRKYRVRDRLQWISSVHPNMLIDIHCNSGVGARGPQVFYWDGATSRLLADYVTDELRWFTHTKRPVTRINQYILRYATVPAINVEVGFINNPREERSLINPAYQRNLAWYIFIGIERWYLRGRWPAHLLKVPPPTELLSR
jgi:N-acetylmuramoyl-L-alanine amidase